MLFGKKLYLINPFQELFYNAKSKSGWILSNLKNRRMVEKRNKNSEDMGSDDENTTESNDQMETYTDENAKDDCMFLRTVVVNSSNRAKIEEKLIATADYRKKIYMDSENSLLKHFPFFFTHSEWVNFTFM